MTTLVFVHGNPETAAIWTPLQAAMSDRATVTLSPPGFGAPVPAGFAATSDAYVDWLVAELERFDEPVDLLGHDWGGGHVTRAVIARPDLVRRWCIDVPGLFDPEYVWHDAAQIWQRPGDGEAFVEGMREIPEDQRAAMYAGLGMTPEAAQSCAELASTPELWSCMLTLYRSAVQPNLANWGAEMRAPMSAGRSLMLIPTEDTYTGGELLARRTAQRWGAKVAVLQGLGHWWMLQDPVGSAAILDKFFAGDE